MLSVLPVVPVVVLAVLIVGSLPVWRWSRGWGWAPAGMLTMGLVALVGFSLTVAPE